MATKSSTIQSDTNNCHAQTKRPTINRRRSLDCQMMKFFTRRNDLFMIPELPVEEDARSPSSFTCRKTPTKPSASRNLMKNTLRKQSIVQTTLSHALDIVDAEDAQPTSLHSISTLSTISMSDSESDFSSHDGRREARAERREPVALVSRRRAPRSRGSRRWDEQSRKKIFEGDEHYLAYSRRFRDSAPTCPQRHSSWF